MFGSYFTQIVDPPIIRPSFVNKKEHSIGCRMLGKGVILMIDLDVIMQDLVLECPHWSHDSVKKIFVISCQSERSKEIEEGRLF